MKLARADEMIEPRVGVRLVEQALKLRGKQKLIIVGGEQCQENCVPNATAKEPCPACHGTGKKTIANTSVSDCEECGRTGRRPCDVCGGTGEVEHLSVALNGS